MVTIGVTAVPDYLSFYPDSLEFACLGRRERTAVVL